MPVMVLSPEGGSYGADLPDLQKGETCAITAPQEEYLGDVAQKHTPPARAKSR
jgi:hypothetical protein